MYKHILINALHINKFKDLSTKKTKLCNVFDLCNTSFLCTKISRYLVFISTHISSAISFTFSHFDLYFLFAIFFSQKRVGNILVQGFQHKFYIFRKLGLIFRQTFFCKYF